MHTKNQISRICKTFYGAMILAVFLVAFGIRNLLSARAQGSATKTPTGAVVSLSADKATFDAAEDITLGVIIANPTSHSIRVHKWFIPSKVLKDHYSPCCAMASRSLISA